MFRLKGREVWEPNPVRQGLPLRGCHGQAVHCAVGIPPEGVLNSFEEGVVIEQLAGGRWLDDASR